ncbi:MAG: DUF1934 domain-containing protein [Bacillota bacterium]
MRKEVLVTVKGTLTDELGEQETIELVTRGSYFCRSDDFYIVYNESEVSGMAGTTTTLKAEPSRVTLNRMGAQELKQIFEVGVPNRGNYVTPFGSMFCDVFPHKVEVDLTEVGGSINLEYDLALDRQRIGSQALEITVREV